MYAEGKSLEFLLEEEPLEIPFFQRSYVWNESNWKELIDDLLRTGGKNFLGSLIIKRVAKKGSVPAHGIIIDGQQRLTTLSILVKVMYEILFDKKQLDGKIPEYARNGLFNCVNSKYKIRISHSHLDKENFESVIGSVEHEKGDKSHLFISSPCRETVLEELKNEDEINKQLVADGKKEKLFEVDRNNLIRSCYKYFYFKLLQIDIKTIKKLFNKLFEKDNNILVIIDIDSTEQEQDIFDTINSAGVPLSAGDIIKNALYDRLKRTKISEEALVEYYNNTWVANFENEDVDRHFWTEKRNIGRCKRDNIELLFQSIAIIKGLFDVENDTLSMLSKRYKEYIEKLTTEKDIKAFIDEIMEYARIYKQLPVFSNSKLFKWDDVKERVSCIIGVSENTTFMPYILYLYKTFEGDDKTLISRLEILEKILMHYIITGASNKNFNKYCSELITYDRKGEKELKKYITGKYTKDENNAIDNFTKDDIEQGLKKKSNLFGKLILFWVELYRNSSNAKGVKNFSGYSFAKELELEHIMPQKWDAAKSPWLSVKCIDENGNVISDKVSVKKYRDKMIYSIGNMTILPKKLNISVSNDSFETKLKGKNSAKGKHLEGIEECSSFSITTEIFPKAKKYTSKKMVWDESVILKREQNLTAEILTIWPLMK